MPDNTNMPSAQGGVPQMPKNTEPFTERPISSEQAPDLYGVKTKAVPVPKTEIGVDRDNTFYDNLIAAGKASSVDMTTLDSFLETAQGRERLYQLIDTMTEDPTIAAVLETYAEDATETNDHGKIIWCESDDEHVSSMVNYLLDSLNVDKHAYGWVAHLCKYGDLYLRLYRQSDFDDGLFEDQIPVNDRKLNESLEPLNEDVIVNMARESDKYVHYIERVANPATMFELTKFGKTYAYIKADVSTLNNPDDLTAMTYGGTNYNRYRFNKRDVNIYQPTEYVHAYLEDDTSRDEEQVDIFMGNNKDEDEASSLSYSVRRGKSLLYNSFKIWREMMLLQNSLLLNRLTKSSIVRAIEVEVGDMPQEKVGPHLLNIKHLIEQKASLDTGNAFTEYTNPGPMENTIYLPVHDGKGSIQIQQIGGDVDVKGLSDIDYFTNLLFSALRVPKQFLGFTDDNAGFSGGQSLSLISSRYAKAIKRIQNTMCQAITDCINLLLLDKGLDSYINKFVIRMQEPTTQEALDRRNAYQAQLGMVGDAMNLFGDIQTPITRLKLLKQLLGDVIDDPEILTLIEEELQAMEEGGMPNAEGDGLGGSYGGGGGGFDGGGGMDLGGGGDLGDLDLGMASEEGGEDGAVGADTLPAPEDLGAGDFSDTNLEI